MRISSSPQSASNARNVPLKCRLTAGSLRPRYPARAFQRSTSASRQNHPFLPKTPSLPKETTYSTTNKVVVRSTTKQELASSLRVHRQLAERASRILPSPRKARPETRAGPPHTSLVLAPRSLPNRTDVICLHARHACAHAGDPANLGVDVSCADR